jgi:hypothetical protein
MAVKLSPIGNFQRFLASGVPAVGYKLFTYAAGSTTKQTAYTTSAGTVGLTNPIILDSNGDPTGGDIWLTSGQTYKFVLALPTDTDPPTSPVKTWDNISGVNDASSSTDQWVSGATPTYISATSLSLVGDQTSTYHKGRRLKFTVTAGTVYGTILSSAYTALTTLIVKIDSGALDSGLSAVSYGLLSALNSAEPLIGDGMLCQGRLSLTTAVPVTTSDVTAATTVYFIPYKGNRIAIFDTGNAYWHLIPFSEISIAVPATTSTMYDVFAYNNVGVLTLELLAWTNDTTRATAISLQNGVYVKSTDAGRRYLGSFRTTAVSGQTEDSKAKRYLWNYYNRAARYLYAAAVNSSWTYATATWRQWNANTSNQIDCVIGVAEDAVHIWDSCPISAASTASAAIGIGVDVTNADSSTQKGPGQSQTGGGTMNVTASYESVIAAGRHFFAAIEIVSNGVTTTFTGANSPVSLAAISGLVMG